MLQRVFQPPVDPALRDPERHDIWAGLVVAIIGLLLVLAGARHLTTVGTQDGGSAWEIQLVKAFSSGGLQYADQIAPAPPPKPLDDPAATAAALDKWERDRAAVPAPTWKVRVDTGAKTPCPT